MIKIRWAAFLPDRPPAETSRAVGELRGRCLSLPFLRVGPLLETPDRIGFSAPLGGPGSGPFEFLLERVPGGWAGWGEAWPESGVPDGSFLAGFMAVATALDAAREAGFLVHARDEAGYMDYRDGAGLLGYRQAWEAAGDPRELFQSAALLGG